MRELEFLPSWYPSLRRRKRIIVLQAWALVVLILGMGMWLFMAQRNIADRKVEHDAVAEQLTQTRMALRQLDEYTALRQQLQQQHEVLRKLGLHVEASRLLSALDRVMPREMTLLEINIDTKEMIRPIDLNAPKDSKKQQPPMDRRLTVKLKAVAPTNVDVANFLAELTNVPFFENVAPRGIDPRIERGHEMRQFEVEFAVNLNEAT
jgi:Tfp pilus assembly protein PilN